MSDTLEGKEIVVETRTVTSRDYGHDAASDDGSRASTITHDHPVAKAIRIRGKKDSMRDFLVSSNLTPSAATSLSTSSLLSHDVGLGGGPLNELVIDPENLDSLVTKLLKGDSREGFPEHLQNDTSLTHRLTEVFSFPKNRRSPEWLWNALYDGLSEGAPAINAFIKPPDNESTIPMPLLSWLCQHGSLRRTIRGWSGGSDLVQMALACGADPNEAIPQNGNTPIFFAVKYGSLETVRVLVDRGADVTRTDHKRRTCLWNALERPQPNIVEYLLTEAGLNAHEGFPYAKSTRRRSSIPGVGMLNVAKQTAVDYLFASQLSMALDHTNVEYPWSWKVLGAPSLDDVALCILEFWKRGVAFSLDDTVTISLLGFIMRGDDPNKKKVRYPNYVQAQPALEKLARLFLGLWVPLSLHKELIHNHVDAIVGGDASCSTTEPSEMTSSDENHLIVGGNCDLCDPDTVLDIGAPSIRLHCGHEFCVNCLKNHIATTENKDESDTEKEGTEENKEPEPEETRNEIKANSNRMFCPKCSRPICKAITGQQLPNTEQCKEAFQDGVFGPHALTSQQLRLECHEWKVTTLLRSDDGLRKRLMSMISTESLPVELNTTSVVMNVAEDCPVVPVLGGPVVVPIMVRGVQVLAYISTSSYCTLVSPTVVEIFGFSRNEDLLSQFFRTPFGTDWLGDQFCALTDFECTLTNEHFNFAREEEDEDNMTKNQETVKLPHALMAPLAPCVGIQLGQDFLRSAVWCTMDVQTGIQLDEQGHSYTTVDAFGHSMPIKPKKQELRYHSRDGRTFRKPLYHLEAFREGDKFVCVSDEGLEECDWCTRRFPGERMLSEEHSGCIFCSEECMEEAHKVPKERFHSNEVS